MNWMIDGAYGDLYRQAMGFRQQPAAPDEWAAERMIGRRARPRRAAALARRLAASLSLVRETIRIVFASKEIVS